MNKFTTFLTSFAHRLQTSAVGDVSKIMSPLTRIQSKLEATKVAATASADAARAAMEVHDATAAAAANASAKLKALLG
jgi:hypothetical protein